MNRCKKYNRLISQDMDEELSKEQKKDLSSHLMNCEGCQKNQTKDLWDFHGCGTPSG